MSAKQRIDKFLLAVFEEEDALLKAAQAARARSLEMHDIYTPYVVHGLDDAMGIKRSRLPIVCFVAGLIGCLIGLGFQLWTYSVDWAINVGGKPFHAVPAFIPVTFELTVLIGGLVTVAAFLLRSKLFPGAKPVLADGLVTDHRFVIAIARTDASVSDSQLKQFFLDHGAVTVSESEVRL